MSAYPAGAPAGAAHRMPPVDRLLIIATGSISVSLLPFWLNWFRLAGTTTELRVVLTRTATRFVSPEAVAAQSGRPVVPDDWSAPAERSVHVELAAWADAIVVYPATLHYLARFALGLGDAPSLLALHAFDGPIAVAPALPPGTADGPAARSHLATLAADPRVAVAPTSPGRSVSGGPTENGAVQPLPDVLALLDGLRTGAA